MAVQITPDSTSTLLAAREAAKTYATKRTDSLQEAAGARSRGADSVHFTSSTQASKVQDVHRSLAEVQRGVSALGVAGTSLAQASKHLGWIQSVVDSGKADPSARLALADGLANLDRSVRQAKFESVNVLDGADFSVTSPAGETIKVSVGNDNLLNIASLLASGGRGIHALDLDEPTVSQHSLQRASSLITNALHDVSSQSAALRGFVDRLDGSLAGINTAPLGGKQADSAVRDTAAAIAANPGNALTAQATVAATTVQHLLAD